MAANWQGRVTVATMLAGILYAECPRWGYLRGVGGVTAMPGFSKVGRQGTRWWGSNKFVPLGN